MEQKDNFNLLKWFSDGLTEIKTKEGPSEPVTFNTGDLVWGQIRGFPSWPGKLVDNDDNMGGELEDGKVSTKVIHVYINVQDRRKLSIHIPKLLTAFRAKN